jgi:hypothetical protein
MSKANPDVLQGTLDLLILKPLMRDQCTAMPSEYISNRSRMLLRVKQTGWISSEWGTSENYRRAKYPALDFFGRVDAQTLLATGRDWMVTRLVPGAGRRRRRWTNWGRTKPGTARAARQVGQVSRLLHRSCVYQMELRAANWSSRGPIS